MHSPDIDRPELRPPTASELRIVQLVAVGKTNKEIAADLGLAEDTVKGYLRQLFAAWSVGTRIELIRVARSNGWMACPDCKPPAVASLELQRTVVALREIAAQLEALASHMHQGGDVD